MAEEIDPDVWDEPEMHIALAGRDIGALYRHLCGRGFSQYKIARMTGQSQSEVSEIMHGWRQVIAYDVLARIAEGLGAPRGHLGLAYSSGREDDAYAGRRTPQSGVVEEVDDGMLRRDILAQGSVALVGVPLLGKLLAASTAGPGDLALPSQVGMRDVAEIKNTTDQLRTAARTMGGQARAASAAAAQYGKLLQVPAGETITVRLHKELAALNELAGWCCFDSGSDLHARWHYSQAVDLAQKVGDKYHIASAMRYAGVVDSVRDRPDDALKAFDLAYAILDRSKGDQDKGNIDLMAWLHAVSAYALADMKRPSAVDRLARAQGGWQLSSPPERADQSYQTALVYMGLGKWEKAEQFAASINGAGRHRPVGVFATLLRATIYVHTGESKGLLMAKTAIDAVAPLHSVRARERLAPLVVALEARPGSDAQELARLARRVAT
ncbi:MAG: hypothetical protein ACRDTF_21620 [Pseudonocardiaceae bacterium]